MFELQMSRQWKLKENYAFSSLDILFNWICLHTELKVKLKTTQYNYKLWGLVLELIL